VATRKVLKDRWGKPLLVQAVFFDIGGTLVRGNLKHVDLLHQALVAIGYKVTRDEVVEANDLARRAVTRRRRRVAHRLDSSEASRRWLDNLAAALNLTADRAGLEGELATAIRTIETRAEETVDPDAPALLASLKARRLRLGVISNWSADLPEYLAAQGLAPYFEAIVASEAVGSAKPHRQIFLKGLAALGCAPEHAVHVGDDYWADVVGARDIGMHPVLVDRDHEAVHSDCPTITRLRDLEDLL
jgi:putative hydrolase of the HAD superfamily